MLSDDGRRQGSFLVEARSLSGYSGSPVFIWPSHPIPGLGFTQSAHLKLLGIDWCHLRGFPKPILLSDKRTRHPDGLFIEQNSGMMGVVPAWKIAELLDEDEFVADRKTLADKFEEEGSMASSTNKASRRWSDRRPD